MQLAMSNYIANQNTEALYITTIIINITAMLYDLQTGGL